MNKLYDRIYWHNDTTPALNETNLNLMSKAIDDIDDRVIILADEWVDVVGEVTEIRDECEEFRDQAQTSASNASTSASQASEYADNASASATTADGFADQSEAWAVGQKNGQDVPASDPTYHNNSKYYAEQAEDLIEHATEGAEAWAVGTRGGVPVPSTDPTYHNNSKYYSEESYKNAEAWAVGKRGGQDVPPSDATYHNNARWYSRQANLSAIEASQAVTECDDIKDEVIDMIGGTTFTVDFATGELIYTNESTFSFSINTTTGNLEWEVIA